MRVRIQNGQFGNLVTLVWRYLTPDKIQVWGRWAYPANSPADLQLFVQYSYTGPYSGNMADYTNPDNYIISPESRVYAGYLVSPRDSSPYEAAVRPSVVVSSLPNSGANFFYSAPWQAYTGFAPPIQPLTSALGSMPNFTNNGETFSADLSTEPGLQNLRSIVDLPRKISQVSANWYSQQRTEARQ